MKTSLVVMALLLLMFSVSAPAANLLINGDFALGPDGTTAPGSPALGWNHWWSGGWINRELQDAGGNPPYGDVTNYHYALGNTGSIDNGVYQDVAGTAGITYQLTADASADNWWKPDGNLRIEFYDNLGVKILGVETWFYANGYDGAVGQPWSLRSVTATAPVGTVTVRAALAAAGEGGTVRYDNAVLVPEPATMILLGLGGLLLRRKHA